MKPTKMLSITFWMSCFYFCVVSSLPAVMIPVSTEQLTLDADLVVLGEVIETECFWNRDQSLIFTRTEIYVHEYAKGGQDNAPFMITVEYVGGLVGNVGLRVSDAPVMETGETVVLFLKAVESQRDLGGTVHQVVAGAQGVYKVDQDHIARKGGFTVLLPDGTLTGPDEVKHIIDNDLPVKDLLNMVIEFVKRESNK
ncbi:MAG: hypothetical protein ACYTG7_18665 [Planctomycetota bacterium]|jgi:hypothetical protein